MRPTLSPDDLQAHLAAVVASSDDAILTKTMDGIITSWNAAAERLFGYKADEAIGQPVSLIMPPEQEDDFPSIMSRLRRGERVEHYETVRQHKDGRRIEVSVTVSPVRDATGMLVGASDITRDISTRKRLERALAESEERLQLAAQVAGFGVYDDRGPGQVYWSPELLALFGFPPDTHPAEGAATALERIHPDDREAWLAALAAARDPAGPGLMVAEHRTLRPDGSVVWVAQQGRILFAGEGPERHRERAIGIVQDITARKQAEAEREAFVAALTHDLKNPLATVHGMAQLLQRRVERDGTVEPGRLTDGLTQVVSGTQRVVRMLNELLDVVRLRGGEALSLQPVPCDLVTLAREVLTQHQPQSEHHTLTLVSDVADVVGEWDKERLERVLGNLVGNAIKYSPQGGPVTVRVWREGEPPTAVVSVEDQGLGIPVADLPYVFTYFRRGRNVPADVRGSGVGLASARQLVEQHGGTITVESEEGRGSRFTLRLPLTSPTAVREGATDTF